VIRGVRRHLPKREAWRARWEPANRKAQESHLRFCADTNGHVVKGDPSVYRRGSGNCAMKVAVVIAVGEDAIFKRQPLSRVHDLRQEGKQKNPMGREKKDWDAGGAERKL